MMDSLFKEVARLTKSKHAAGKRCSKCGKYKALKYYSKDAYQKDGCRSSCKDCDRIQQKQSRAKIEYIYVSEKQCSECGRVLPIEKFGVDKTKKDYHRSYCLECMREQQKHRKRIKIVKTPTSKL